MFEGRSRLSKSSNNPTLCKIPVDTELVSTLTHMCNAEGGGSFKATVVSEVHVRPWGMSDSNSRQDEEDRMSTLRVGKYGKLSQPSVKTDEEILGAR
jgi:hypothetical protein